MNNGKIFLRTLSMILVLTMLVGFKSFEVFAEQIQLQEPSDSMLQEDSVVGVEPIQAMDETSSLFASNSYTTVSHIQYKYDIGNIPTQTDLKKRSMYIRLYGRVNSLPSYPVGYHALPAFKIYGSVDGSAYYDIGLATTTALATVGEISIQILVLSQEFKDGDVLLK